MNGEKLKDELAGYMKACYGPDWKEKLGEDQKKELKQAFMSGMIVALGVLSPEEGIETVFSIKEHLKEIGSLP